MRRMHVDIGAERVVTYSRWLAVVHIKFCCGLIHSVAVHRITPNRPHAGTKGGHNQGSLQPQCFFCVSKLKTILSFLCGHQSHVKVQPFADVKAKAAPSSELF